MAERLMHPVVPKLLRLLCKKGGEGERKWARSTTALLGACLLDTSANQQQSAEGLFIETKSRPATEQVWKDNCAPHTCGAQALADQRRPEGARQRATKQGRLRDASSQRQAHACSAQALADQRRPEGSTAESCNR